MIGLHAVGALVAEGPVGLEANTTETLTFWVCATVAVVGALGTVLSRKAVHSALFLAMTMINLAILYVAQDAPFLGMVQIIVYTGAVMMLFVFVLMVVGVDASDSLVETLRAQRLWAAVGFVGFLGLLLAGVVSALDGTSVAGLDVANAEHGGNVAGIGVTIFTRYLLAFEVTSALLITAAVGAMVLTHRERVVPRRTQAEMSTDRFAPRNDPVNKPTPGVYARGNAVDLPALLPDGSVAEESIPGPLRVTGDDEPRAVTEEEPRAVTESGGTQPGGTQPGGTQPGGSAVGAGPLEPAAQDQDGGEL